MRNKNRATFEDLAVKTAVLWSSRSEDLHSKVGACILNKDGRVLSIGYNGLTKGMNKGLSFWVNRSERRKYIIHAEINALSFLNRDDEPSLIATTLLPCSSCAMAIVSRGIKKVIYIKDYELDPNSKEIFKFYNIEVKKYE